MIAIVVVAIIIIIQQQKLPSYPQTNSSERHSIGSDTTGTGNIKPEPSCLPVVTVSDGVGGVGPAAWTQETRLQATCGAGNSTWVAVRQFSNSIHSGRDSPRNAQNHNKQLGGAAMQHCMVTSTVR